MGRYIQVTTTTSTKESAETIGKLLLEKKLISCIQVVGPIKSSYWWKNKIEKSDEWLSLMKSEKKFFKQIEKIIKENHTYETAEITVMPIINGSSEYLKWITDTISGKGAQE